MYWGVSEVLSDPLYLCWARLLQQVRMHPPNPLPPTITYPTHRSTCATPRHRCVQYAHACQDRHMHVHTHVCLQAELTDVHTVGLGHHPDVSACACCTTLMWVYAHAAVGEGLRHTCPGWRQIRVKATGNKRL